MKRPFTEADLLREPITLDDAVTMNPRLIVCEPLPGKLLVAASPELADPIVSLMSAAIIAQFVVHRFRLNPEQAIDTIADMIRRAPSTAVTEIDRDKMI